MTRKRRSEHSIEPLCEDIVVEEEVEGDLIEIVPRVHGGQDPVELPLSSDFEAATKFYRRNRSKLLQNYEGKFIAIFNNEAVDSAEDFGELALRVYQRFGYRDIFMPKVERKPRTVRVPSPRLRA